MKTKEFIKRVEELGYGVISYGHNHKITNNGEQIACVDELVPMQISNYYWAYDKLCNADKEKFYNLLVEYAKTPIEEREEPKKYYLRYKWINADYNYLNYDCRLDVYGLDRILSFNWIKGKFTLEEIEDIKEKYDTKLEDFEIVEVEE